MTVDDRGWIGIDLGATKVLVSLYAPDWSLRQEIRIDSQRDDGPERIVARTGDVVKDLVASDDRGVRGVGVATTCFQPLPPLRESMIAICSGTGTA